MEICGVQLFFILTSSATKMHAVMKRQYLLSLFHRTIRGYRSLVEQYPESSYDDGSKLAKRTHVSL
jgi:hypothetical protein